ncbi:MAG: 5'/3'-nucleotidase SurE [bacterium]|nr:5'/3'-nucleotidase SurE [bacterium]
MEILLTNDDSHDSPLFHIAIEKLKRLGNVTVVVPKEEQSWTGKSITRFDPLRVEEISIAGEQVWCLNGRPADCANFGIYHLFEQKPDLVVSGINIGSNTGVAYTFSSGTIGACLEGNIAGVPAVGLSQVLAPEVFRYWDEHRELPDKDLKRLQKQIDEILDRVFEMLMARSGFYTEPVTWNVNLPFQAVEDWQIVPAFLGHNFYGSCFKKSGAEYRHQLERPAPDERDEADGHVVTQGHVSLSRLDIRSFGRLDGWML